jgi:hypothetical protein
MATLGVALSWYSHGDVGRSPMPNKGVYGEAAYERHKRER